MATEARDSRLSFRLPSELKEIIEDAAALVAQSVGDFAVGTLVQHAQAVMHQQRVTVLTNQDRDRFVALLDETVQPNSALIEAAERYEKNLG